jgi:hypothetical protein
VKFIWSIVGLGILYTVAYNVTTQKVEAEAPAPFSEYIEQTGRVVPILNVAANAAPVITCNTDSQFVQLSGTATIYSTTDHWVARNSTRDVCVRTYWVARDGLLCKYTVTAEYDFQIEDFHDQQTVKGIRSVGPLIPN